MNNEQTKTTHSWNWFGWFVVAGMIFSENNYFGWNALPKSDAEMVCDLIILATAALLWGRK